MREIYLRQPKFTYSACGPFKKNKERIKKKLKIGDTWCIYHKKLGKVCRGVVRMGQKGLKPPFKY